MAQSITQPTFRTGPSDDLATRDVYSDITGNETVNKLKSLTTEYSKDAITPITGNTRKAAKELTPALVSLSQEKGKMTNAQVLSRLGMASPTLGRSFNGINTGLQKAIMDGMQTSVLPKSVQIALNNRISNVDFKNVSSIDGIGKVIKDFTGVTAFETRDPRSISSFLSSSIGIAMDMGVDGLTKDILETVNDSAIKDLVASTLATKATNKSNTMDLYYLSLHAQPGVIIYSNPEIISQYCKKYNRAKKLTYSQYIEEYNYLIAAFDKIDPQWDRHQRLTSAGPEDCVSIASMICNNADLADLFNVVVTPMADESVEKAYLVSSLHQTTSVESALRTEFPAIVFGFTGTTQTLTSALDI